MGLGKLPIVRDMRMSSVLLWGEIGARSNGGSLNFGFHSHLCTSRFPISHFLHYNT